MVPEALPTEAVLVELVALDHRPHRPVQDEDPAGQMVREKLGAPGAPAPGDRPTRFKGRVWLIRCDSVDTDMIYHNSHLTVTDPAEMGQYALGNLEGWQDFPGRAGPGEIVVAGQNFGAGSSRQQAVDCFESLGIVLIVAASFGAIYERNAVNKGFPILAADLVSTVLETGDLIEVDLACVRVRLPSGREVRGTPFSDVQMRIYLQGGLLNK